MITPELELMQIFLSELGSSLTINQVSKEIKKSYAYTNGFVRQLIDEKIISKKIVGSAILCSLNFNSEKTIGLLALHSINNKTQFIENRSSKEITEITKKIDLYNIPGVAYSVFTDTKKIIIIGQDKKKISEHFAQKNILVDVIDKEEFQLSIKSLDIKKIIVLEGHETFWKLIAKMV